MQVFENEWFAKKGKFSFSVSERHMVDIRVSCAKTVKVYGVREGKSVQLKSGENFRFREKVYGFEKITIAGTGETEFGLCITEGPLREIDYNSGEKAPVVELPEPSNLVARMRAIARSHHSRSMYPVLDPEDTPSFARYEHDDEDELLFEEEAWDKIREAREAKKAKKAVEPLEPPTEEEAAPSSTEPPPAAQAAE